MVMHVDKGHKSASVVSIPRDTLIERPACTSDTTDETVPAQHRAMFNTAECIAFAGKVRSAELIGAVQRAVAECEALSRACSPRMPSSRSQFLCVAAPMLIQPSAVRNAW